MEWIFSHLAEILLGLMIADKIAIATPPDLVIFKIPIGRYDDKIVKCLKSIFTLFKVNPNGNPSK